MADELAKKTDNVTGETPALEADAVRAPRVGPPPPPGINEVQFTAAFMQKPDLFTTLSDEIKGRLLDTMDKADGRQAAHASAELQSSEKLKLQAMSDRASMRQNILRFCFAAGVGGFLVIGTLLVKGDTQSAMKLAHDVGVGLALLLGGAGAGSAVRKYFS